MISENDISLRKVLRPRRIMPLLRGFGALLGEEVTLAVVSEGPDQILADHLSFPLDIAQVLWEAVSEAQEMVFLPQGVAVPICLESRREGLIMAAGPLPTPDRTRMVLTALRHALEAIAQMAIEKRAVAHEALVRYREINLLYDLGETLATCLNVDALLQQVLTEASEIIQAQRGVIFLYNAAGDLIPAAYAGLDSWRDSSTEMGGANAFVRGQALIEEVARTGKPQIVNDYTDPDQSDSPMPLLAAPLLTTERKLGAILLIGKDGEQIFTAGDERLLSALAWQAAIALENARLFDDVRRQRDEITMMKRYMDNIFDSIASGLITIDNHDIITTFNRAAQRILAVPIQQVVNRPYQEALGFLRYTPLPGLIENVRLHQNAYVAQEVTLNLSPGKPLHLNISLSPLQGKGKETLGVAIVLENVTEKRLYERERSLIRRYLPYGLVDLLPLNMSELGLGEERRVITVLFADIRGFTSFSEITPPERVMEVLNNYLTLCEAAVRFNWGIVDKYMGDAILAFFNTPLLEQEEHAWRAVRMAWTLKQAVEAYHNYTLPEERLFLGFGICTGVVVVGNVGTEDRMEYTAVGDTVNVARRLQESARPGQILISYETWKSVQDRVRAQALPAMRVRGRKTYTRAYEVVGIDDIGW